MPTVTPRQAEFLGMPHKYRLLVAGYGSGKSWAGCCGLAMHFLKHPGVAAGYFAPTYPQIRDIFYPTVSECLADWGLDTLVRTASKEVIVSMGGQERGIIKCRSMDRPESIVGFKIGHALVDEIDVMPEDKATAAWRKILARMRFGGGSGGLRNGIDVTTTPEGFKFAWRQFVKAPRERPELCELYGVTRASTWDNAANLPEDYIPSLMQSYPEHLVRAYIDGEFVNLTSGTVYNAFSREHNATTETARDGEILYVGMDFNVGRMAAVIHVRRAGPDGTHMALAVDEIVGAYDTPDMIRRLKERYWRFEPGAGTYHATRQIRIYPDASGCGRRTVSAAKSDISLLRDAGFVVSASASNPPVRDRVNAMNAMFRNALGERRYLVNLERCPSYAEALEQQAWDKHGEPDKSSGLDHILDAAGYFIVRDFPATRRGASVFRAGS